MVRFIRATLGFEPEIMREGKTTKSELQGNADHA